jgi:hypothetical protein
MQSFWNKSHFLKRKKSGKEKSKLNYKSGEED